MYHYTAIVTLLAIAVYFYSSILVSRARGKFGVKLPAISGNPDFERVFRAQMNTLEWLPIFLPSLWLFAIYIGDGIAAALGLIWAAGRILYVLGYAKAVEKRSPGLIQTLATIALWSVRSANPVACHSRVNNRHSIPVVPTSERSDAIRTQNH
jgi:glutathione S-transferase